jgi:hypothetical protein
MKNKLEELTCFICNDGQPIKKAKYYHKETKQYLCTKHFLRDDYRKQQAKENQSEDN